jgi:hypothetical protein
MDYGLSSLSHYSVNLIDLEYQMGLGVTYLVSATNNGHLFKKSRSLAPLVRIC